MELCRVYSINKAALIDMVRETNKLIRATRDGVVFGVDETESCFSSHITPAAHI